MSQKTRQVLLECTSGGHNKFYEITAVKQHMITEIITRHGRIGQSGRILSAGSYHTEGDVLYTVNTMIEKKQAKGYQIKHDLSGQALKDHLKDPKAPKDEIHVQESTLSKRFGRLLGG